MVKVSYRMDGIRLWGKISVIILLTLVVSLVAYTPAQANFDEKWLVEKSEKLSEKMAAGDFEAVANEFADGIKQQLTVDKLQAGWRTAVADIGQYQGIYKSEVSIENNQARVAVTLIYERRGLIVLLSYDVNNQINGLFIRPSAPPVSHEPISHEKFEETKILIGTGEVRLNGLLTLPKGVNRPSVVILLHGSGPNDMDETIGAAANKPFRDIAHGLAERGIASIRYNKRNWQYPATKDSTIQDEVVHDAIAAIQYAKQSNTINPQKIYILGHSLGGMLSPYIASTNNDVAGIISLAGSPRKFEDIILSQNIAFFNAMSGITKEEKDAIISQRQLEIAKVKAIKPTDPPTTILGASSSYWSSLHAINTPLICKELRIPMLIMQGGRDFQILADVDYKIWQDILQGRDNVEFKLYKDLNHLFMPVSGPQDITAFQTAYDARNNVDDGVLVDIANWIHRLQ